MRDLLYPLGFIANLCFFFRFIYQWFYSEVKKESIVDKSFWKISFLGNIVMTLHTMIQLQLGVCLIQTLNAVISWRNLNLMKEQKKQWTFRSSIILIICALLITVSTFVIQSRLFFDGVFIWARTPQFLGEMAADPLSIPWHIFGIVGVTLFASRFWIQWWHSEMKQRSIMGKTFWWISLGGAAFSSIYFMMMFDIVNCIGPIIGMIPYIRNLVLINRKQASGLVS